MLEILVCEDQAVTAALYEERQVRYELGRLAIRAMFGEECLGYCLFAVNGEEETVFCVEPREDVMLADGLLRSALHVGCERGITAAFYADRDYEPLFRQLHFLEQPEEKRLRLQNLFTDCCHCGEQENT